MPTPDFVLALRAHVGHQSLPLVGVTAVVLRDENVLLVRRADNRRWTPVTGIVNPGEEPADAAARETLEEAGVVAEPQRLALVHTLPPVTYPNGDVAQFLDLVFLMRWVAGEPFPADDENIAAYWFPLDDLPKLEQGHRARIEAARSLETTTRFVRSRRRD
ncbi:NUDIX hydrolase [Cellulomonas composti]|uniref:NUDIX hydrolase n=1 Tax=Cellulomonas composti TaxID=266130 RepID=UPI0011BDE507|nr:NUDIX domain-containing protein [Cellulomonas composti]